MVSSLYISFQGRALELERRSEPLEGIYGRFPSVDPVAVRARVPYLGKIYIEKKPLEPKLH